MGPQQIYSALKCLIENHVIVFCGKFYIQTRGIPQGSALSVLLCNLYLGALEQDNWPELLDNKTASDSLMVRHVDDFLLATTRKPLAERFVNSMSHGFDDYGVCGKPGKTFK